MTLTVASLCGISVTEALGGIQKNPWKEGEGIFLPLQKASTGLRSTFLSFSQANCIVDGGRGGTIGPDCFYLVCSCERSDILKRIENTSFLDSWGCEGRGWAAFGTELITTLKKLQYYCPRLSGKFYFQSGLAPKPHTFLSLRLADTCHQGDQQTGAAQKVFESR